ncbi:MAG: hypothetical protein JXR70_12385, partial [Spirochaetales bacterium]|nr:hypothetical protein [Spirochaetales bacterium]
RVKNLRFAKSPFLFLYNIRNYYFSAESGVNGYGCVKSVRDWSHGVAFFQKCYTKAFSSG